MRACAAAVPLQLPGYAQSGTGITAPPPPLLAWRALGKRTVQKEKERKKNEGRTAVGSAAPTPPSLSSLSRILSTAIALRLAFSSSSSSLGKSRAFFAGTATLFIYFLFIFRIAVMTHIYHPRRNKELFSSHGNNCSHCPDYLHPNVSPRAQFYQWNDYIGR